MPFSFCFYAAKEMGFELPTTRYSKQRWYHYAMSRNAVLAVLFALLSVGCLLYIFSNPHMTILTPWLGVILFGILAFVFARAVPTPEKVETRVSVLNVGLLVAKWIGIGLAVLFVLALLTLFAAFGSH